MNYNKKNYTLKLIGQIFIAPIICIAILLIRFSDIEGARKTLIHQNFKPIELSKYDYPIGAFKGSYGDIYVTKFKAIAPNGDVVTGTVTSGLFKGSTLRLDE